MSNTFYTCLSGMLAASYGLQNTSSNVANMQSPGFKKSELFYSSLGGNEGFSCLGSGVTIGGKKTNFSAGSYNETGNPSDMAIVGNGFFIIRMKNNELLYTRDGQFGFNDDGLMIDQHSGGLVQGYNDKGMLVPISQFGPKNSDGRATHYVDLKGDFVWVEVTSNNSTSTDTKEAVDIKNVEFKLNKIFDSEGKEHSIKVVFKLNNDLNPVPNSDKTTWDIEEITSEDGTPISFDPSQQIKFSSNDNGSPEELHNKINFTLNGNQQVTLKFGDFLSDENKRVTLKSAAGTDDKKKIEIIKQDGYAQGKQLDYSIDDNGQITYNYNNNQKIAGIHVALATFDNLDSTLIAAKDNMFRAKNENDRHIGRANKGEFGAIQAKKLEASNVDSTTEFANIVVLQRMFQACSQIMDIDKQLLEELEKK